MLELDMTPTEYSILLRGLAIFFVIALVAVFILGMAVGAWIW